jgi:hypothetical protein
MSLKAPRYGTIPIQDEVADSSFDADQAYYLKETSRPQWRRRILGGLPLLAALLIMGGVSYLLYRSFDRLYPGPGGGREEPAPIQRKPINREDNHKNILPPEPPLKPPEPPLKPPEPPLKPPAKPSKNDYAVAQCTAYPKCSALIGDCCPTDQGIILECCAG